MSDEDAFARAYQAVGEYFCAFSALDRQLGLAVKVVLDLDRHPAGDFVVAALEDPARKANLVLAAVAVAKNADGSETSAKWKKSAEKTVKKALGHNKDTRVAMAHSYLEPQADGSGTLKRAHPAKAYLGKTALSRSVSAHSEALQMAWRIARGLFRLWLVLSVLWIGGVGVVTWREYPDDWVRVCGEGEPPGTRGCLPPGFVIDPRPFWADPAIHRGIFLALVLPAFLLALGSALVWAFRGFRQP